MRIGDLSPKTELRKFVDTIAQLDGVSKRFRDCVALENVSLTLRPGVTGLLGPNGSGKSTLIKALLGLVRVTAGQGIVLDMEWPTQTRLIRDQIGYLPEDDCYILGLQGVESVQMMARLSGLPRLEALRRAHEVLDFCDVGQERYRSVETYSTGMRQKLKFAQALVHDPPLVILDEPTTGLDPTQREEFLNRIATLARRHGKSVLLSTHILHDVRQVCDQVVILVRGRVRIADSLENLSRPAQPGLHLSVIEGADRFAEHLRSRGLDAEISRGHWLRVRGIEAHEAARLWRLGVEAGVAIERLEPARNSLEQTFLDAVRADQHADS